jgi:PadR family transcriptional regulator
MSSPRTALLLTFHRSRRYSPVSSPQEWSTADRLDILQGTLDLMVLRTLFASGPQHGYGIARRIEQLSGNSIILNQGTIYISLVRLENRGWIKSKAGVSENNRRAKFYSITAAGRKQLEVENEQWERLIAMMARLLPAEAT